MLTDNDCKNAKFGVPIKKIGEIRNKRFDGGGLYLELTRSGSKLWRMAYRIANPKAGQEGQKGKLERTFYIDGPYPAVSLADARAQAAAARVLVKRGIDPNANKKQVVAASTGTLTFAALAEQWHTDWLATTTRAVCSRGRHEEHKNLLIAKLGKFEPDKIKPNTILEEVLDPYRTAKPKPKMHQARRIRSCADWIFAWGIAKSLCETNPAKNIPMSMLQGEKAKNRPALTDAVAFGGFLRDIHAYDTEKYGNVTGIALKLLPLLAVRPYKEFCRIELSEIDFESARWTIPAERMKEGELHMVPLSRQALELFRQLRNINGNRKYLMALGDSDKPMARTTLGRALIAMGYKSKQTAHGLRRTFSTMLNKEYNGNVKVWDRDVIELQLAHLEGSTRDIYFEREAEALWEQRANLMQHWADKCDAMRGANVVEIKQAA